MGDCHKLLPLIEFLQLNYSDLITLKLFSFVMYLENYLFYMLPHHCLCPSSPWSAAFTTTIYLSNQPIQGNWDAVPLILLDVNSQIFNSFFFMAYSITFPLLKSSLLNLLHSYGTHPYCNGRNMDLIRQ